MYTLDPIFAPEPSHFMWYALIFASGLACALIAFIPSMEYSTSSKGYRIYIGGVVCAYLALVVFTGMREFRDPPVYKNEQVTAEFIDWVPESSKTGKVTRHVIYARLKVPGGETLLAVPEGRTVGQTITIFKN